MACNTNLQSSNSLKDNSISLIKSSLPLPVVDISIESNNSCEIDKPFSLRIEYQNHPLIGFLNINSLRKKITDLRVLMKRCLPDVLVIEETKLNSDFQTKSFLVNNYQKPLSRDRNEFGGGGYYAIC